MKKIKLMLFVLLALSTVITATGCAESITPYETNNAENYTVSVKFDANGGIFTTSTSVIVDSYNISELPKNSEGMAEIALISPDNPVRGKNDAFMPTKNDSILAGWYSGKTESMDSEGNQVYSYSGRWDFETDKLSVDPSKSYSAETPVLTLYAAWVPVFGIEFYSLSSGELLDRINIDPSELGEILLPTVNNETGKVNMFKFPQVKGYTFVNAYYDEKGENVIEGEKFAHPGKLNYENGTAENSVLKIYVEYKVAEVECTAGYCEKCELHHIYTAKQFVDNFKTDGVYEILADLDFSDVTWKDSIMTGNFNGEIIGNGHSFKNINALQPKVKATNIGIFGKISDKAKISDLTFENVTFDLTGMMFPGANYGLLTGELSGSAVLENVSITAGQIRFITPFDIRVNDFVIGLVCGIGNSDAVVNSEIECVAIGDAPESIVITVDGNDVIVAVAEE